LGKGVIFNIGNEKNNLFDQKAECRNNSRHDATSAS
jgi:hypothetical protein